MAEPIKKHETLAAALAAAQSEMKNPAKDAEVEVQTTKGGKYKYRYVTLPVLIDEVRPVLSKHGICFFQPVSFAPYQDDSTCGIATVTTTLLHESGEERSCSLGLPCDATPQAIGTAISYGRRYGLQSMCGLASEDDDDAGKAQDGAEKRVAIKRDAVSAKIDTAISNLRKAPEPKPEAPARMTGVPSWMKDIPEDQKIEISLKLGVKQNEFLREVDIRARGGMLPAAFSSTDATVVRGARYKLICELLGDISVVPTEMSLSEWDRLIEELKQQYPVREDL